MGNTHLLRHEVEMTLLQPHLGDSRHQNLRNLPFWPTPLFRSQLVKDGEDFLLKKGSPKDSQSFQPYQNKPFRGPHHNKKRGSFRKRSYGGNSSQGSNQLFSSVRGKSNNRGFRGHFRPYSRGRGLFRQCVKHYHQWLRSSIHLKTKFSPPDSIRLQGPSKDQALASCIQSLLSKNAIERVENVKSLGF